MQITSADMQKFGHKDEWGVDCLYLVDVQKLFASKLREAAKPLLDEVKSFNVRALRHK